MIMWIPQWWMSSMFAMHQILSWRLNLKGSIEGVTVISTLHRYDGVADNSSRMIWQQNNLYHSSVTHFEVARLQFDTAKKIKWGESALHAILPSHIELLYLKVCLCIRLSKKFVLHVLPFTHEPISHTYLWYYMVNIRLWLFELFALKCRAHLHGWPPKWCM